VSVAGKGTLLLFLHGIRGSRHHWARQVEFFSRHFRAAAWDARGYGDSEDYEGALQFDEHFSADVLRVADHFGADKMHLVGLSMGGRIAQLREELDAKGLRFPLHFYLSDEWFTPDGVPGVAVPFYLAHSRLAKLELAQMLERFDVRIDVDVRRIEEEQFTHEPSEE